eukprot:TRINITY_DN5780_c0_g2_i1.p1 TRINITY_DN5780_c0_g2~~TRINITY_DN5780_c0_g2_i1.p1  ORF type:complete len:390 (-),score=87.26 TRINITY_DN5780_c0_g2_i1:452-1621(-)
MAVLRYLGLSCGAAVALVAVGIASLQTLSPRHFADDACSNSVSEASQELAAIRPFRCGWQEVRGGVHAFFQPNGSWCWSNAGYIASEGLLVDTLTDPRLTRGMLAAVPGKLDALVYTHPDIDHIMGDQEVPAQVPRYARTEVGLEIKAQAGAARPFVAMIALGHLVWSAAAHLGWRSFVDTAAWPLLSRVLGWARLQEAFASFSFHEFDASKVVGVTKPFATPEIRVGDAEVHYLGAIHSKSDSVVLLRSARVCFAGDLLFIGIAPVMWSGPAKSWVEALGRLLEKTGDDWLFVPGHGPVTDARGVRFLQRYFSYLDDAVSSCGADLDDTSCARKVLAELPAELRTPEPQRILISARVERLARRSATGTAQVDLPSKVRFLSEQGEYML